MVDLRYTVDPQLPSFYSFPDDDDERKVGSEEGRRP